MHFAFILRQRRRLLMQLDPTRTSHRGSPSSSPLKRPYAQQAVARDDRRAQAPPSSPDYSLRYSGSSGPSTSPLPRNNPLIKIPKLEGTRSPAQSAAAASSSRRMSHPNHPPTHPGGPSEWRSGKPSTPPAPRSTGRRPKSSGFGMKGKYGMGSSKAILTGPVHDEAHIEATYKVKPLKSNWLENPKSPISNFVKNQLDCSADYHTETLYSNKGQQIYRTTLAIKLPDGDIIAYGDSPNKKDSERLASINGLYQLDGKDLMDKKPKKLSATTEVTLSDSSVVDYERARQFVDYYCRRFKFGKPDLTYTEVPVRRGICNWDVAMTIDGRKIGLGSGTSKKAATISCYVDVTQYLESCDSELWQRFVADAKTGKDLGMATSFFFQSNDVLEDQITNLSEDIQRGTLYRNRPKLGSALAVTTTEVSSSSGPRYIAPSRRHVDEQFLQSKSEALQKRRQEYLQDPRMERMRKTRAALPVYTKAEDLLAHIRENEVTICMATTGSGKTTQIPQLILDELIDKGEGSKCNIICTQPRRLAAISVASRVAAERGETVGKGSVGYQVRFETNLPEDHGSITFCTTGIFLKRMHTALQDGGAGIGRGLDEVTHVIVDEVHERDVDVDLLLVVLKRLLADRRERKIPIKIILMSATIDPTLFQQYFPDLQARPASVTEIPGRSFPVQKHFLDDFVPKLISSSTSSTNWVFRDEKVQKYLARELGSLDALPPALTVGSKYRSYESSTSDEDLDLPYPLVAFTISHVLRHSDDGHVLVFLPGWDDISKVQKLLLDDRQPLGLRFSDTSKFSIHLLHSSVPVAEQQVIFDPPPPGVRRIILSTNIAETSVTIPDVVYVVDTAKIKEQRYEPERHISSLVSAWVGSSNLNQRAGRAGRHRPGEYYGIIGHKRAQELHPYQTVEMKRVDLSNVVMHVKALNFPAMTAEEVLAALIEPPAEERVAAAMESLRMVGALDEDKNLTSLGRVLLQLPVEPQMGKLVLFGSFFRCLDQALTLAAILTNRDPFMSPMHLKAQAAERKNSFSPAEFRSDALTILRAYNAWWAMQGRGEYIRANRFCMDNFLSKPTLLMIQKIKGHLLQSLYDIGVIDVSAGGSASSRGTYRRDQESGVPDVLNQNGESLPLLAALITIASQPKFAIRTGERSYRTAVDKAVFVHPSSVNHRKREIEVTTPEGSVIEKHILAYAEKRQNVSTGNVNAQRFLVTTTRIDPLTYMLFGAYHVEITEKGLICDEWLPMVGNLSILDDVERLKVRMEACMLRVFEGITQGRSKRSMRGGPMMRREEREYESGDEDDEGMKDYSLSDAEIREFDLMSRDIVRILNEYSTYRIASQSRQNSRPATPMGSPTLGPTRLPSFSGSRSGYSTPYNHGGAFSSRPSTPSKLSRRW